MGSIPLPASLEPTTIYRSDAAVVAHVDLASDASRDAAALAWLDEAERSRWKRFLQPQPQRRFTLCRASLRTVLCRTLSCANDELSFGTSAYGKPFALVGGVRTSIEFNVSHSGRHGLVALAPKGRIGVDVEERSARRDIDGDIRLLFTPEERARLNEAHGHHRLELFWRLWTMKEALLKALGTGLSRDTASFTIPPATSFTATARRVNFRFPDMPSTRWRLQALDDTRFAAALAVEIPTPPHSHSNGLDEPDARGSGT